MTINVGLIGLGMMGRHHARVLREIEGVELVAVADAMGDPHGVAGSTRMFKSVEGLLKAGVDAAVVAVPTKFHEEIGLKLAEAGVHTLIEKPVAHDLPAAERLVEAFDKAGVFAAVGHVERFNPALMSMRERIANGDLGEVYQIHTRRQGPFPARIADVGVVKDLGSHDIDLTSWVAQSLYERISANTTYRSGREHEDMVSITGTLKNGIMVNHLVNWLTPFKERLTVVTGERGAYVADTLTADLTFYENGTLESGWDAVTAFRGVSEGTVTRFALEKREPLRNEHEAFRDAILGVRDTAVTLREGLETLRVAEAAIASGKSGESIELN
ncbi:Gfo/Idh/MocA family oxidoreductase [Leucobacter sp. UCMA 4100]|uniref:Gfo/Idh/MocA family protein n=1 Tax=Leucobacter sp. UCMA 4100 TaxID=2810534 RepID=UPI0022EAD210|nr:Gfo/Idh/MocA family oxidoreductase [Leucobacter sp. UCMA 4100]MDA3146646.1 Gfo/Idh/MocA family oxidoreductase [Leucobacter sp. UCMA 4100]